MPRIRIVIKDGKIQADFSGYKGNACETDAKKLLSSLSKLGKVRADVRKKQESDDSSVIA